MAKIELTRLSSKGQIVIPRKIRKLLELEEGTSFIVDENKGIIMLKKLELQGIKKHKSKK